MSETLPESTPEQISPEEQDKRRAAAQAAIEAIQRSLKENLHNANNTAG